MQANKLRASRFDSLIYRRAARSWEERTHVTVLYIFSVSREIAPFT